MRKNFYLSFLVSILLLAILVLADLLDNRIPQGCIDSEANCQVGNINVSDDTREQTRLNSPQNYLYAYTFNGTVPTGSIINNVTIQWEWLNEATDRGASQQNFSYYNGSVWTTCAGPFGNQPTETVTTCTNLQSNFTTVDSINNINVSYVGVDANGPPYTWFYLDKVNVTVDYTPPNAKFTVMMPSSYTCPSTRYCFNISAETEETANATSWISFNFTTPTSIETDVEPCVTGNCTDDKQSGNTKPIFLIDNTGTNSINLSIRFNETLPIGINVSANSTCPTNNCTYTVATKSLLNTSYIRIVGGLNRINSFANVSLWADKNSSAPGGETRVCCLFMNSSLA